jgi:hypothetical protein
MAEKNTMNEEFAKKATYQQAITIPGGGQPAEASEALHNRIVVTSQTHGTVNLRYAPRTPKAMEPVDTDS